MKCPTLLTIGPEHRKAARERFLKGDAQFPGLKLVVRWFETGTGHGVTIFETDDPVTLSRYGPYWNDLIDTKTVPVNCRMTDPQKIRLYAGGSVPTVGMIRQWRPWQRCTGPGTPEGTARSRNLRPGVEDSDQQQDQRDALEGDPGGHVARAVDPVVFAATLHGVEAEDQGDDRGAEGQQDQDREQVHGAPSSFC